ncbi:trypsin I-P1-like [Oratosquilla oratoria]|uniref:trypsin I-P1-like n=1 Tax=Oratosquilla oratoria TaxID=337810 RepID=UPI003F775074
MAKFWRRHSSSQRKEVEEPLTGPPKTGAGGGAGEGGGGGGGGPLGVSATERLMGSFGNEQSNLKVTDPRRARSREPESTVGDVNKCRASSTTNGPPRPPHPIIVTLLLLVLVVKSQANINFKAFCGESFHSHRYFMRIVGGRGAALGEWPWQVALQQKDPYSGKGLGQHCGGTLIHPSWILTAAHCIVDPIFKFALPPPFWLVRVGEISLSAETPATYAVSKIITHKYFNAKTWDNDVALVKLRRGLKLEDYGGLVNTICLPARNTTFVGHHCMVTGWGRTKQHGSNSDLLQTIRVPVIPNGICRKAYQKVNTITQGMICAGWSEGGQGPCVGDSGGPLQCREGRGGPWVQAGITSWGVGCAEPGYPGVYIRVTEFLDWIYQHIDKNFV